MPETVIDIVDVQKSYGEGALRNQVLFDITQQFNSGELTMIVGPSGCGKTTLISIIGGILEPDSGKINVYGKKIHKMTDDEKTDFRKDNIGFIFQHHNLIPTLTVKENVAVPLLIQGRNSTDEIDKRVMNLINKFGIDHRADYYPKEISGGEQQRVAVARALVTRPRLVICDEPTASLDSKAGKAVVQMLKDIAIEENKCVIVVSHDTRIFKFADRIIRLDDGRIKSDKHLARRNIDEY